MLIVKGEKIEFFRLLTLFFNLDLIDYEGLVNHIGNLALKLLHLILLKRYNPQRFP